MNTATKIIISIGSIAIVATAGIGGLLLATSDDTASTTTPATTTSSTTSSSGSSSDSSTSSASTSESSSTESTSSYQDGTYTATSSYSVPRGVTNSISATVTVSGGKITSVVTDNTYSDHESGMYIDSFESDISSAAVGTSLADATFSRIGGASLTTEGFNSVLDEIRTQATA